MPILSKDQCDATYKTTFCAGTMNTTVGDVCDVRARFLITCQMKRINSLPGGLRRSADLSWSRLNVVSPRHQRLRDGWMQCRLPQLLYGRPAVSWLATGGAQHTWELFGFSSDNHQHLFWINIGKPFCISVGRFPDRPFIIRYDGMNRPEDVHP